MASEKIAAVLGTIVALVVLAAAFIYVPPGSSNAPARPAEPVTAPAAPVNAAPATPGPVVKDVPQQ
ncbi:hypothetical protein [Bradyrhizobium sp. dw_78]|uniref:hypothetical protein n=1 Tax=Bradyrhizobium sp. dw_78 TaxID=2719793 RepID=UPI001BD5F4DB|nr:hypothetical protein [Bradyrhizobium sp. dw_78]